MASRLSGRLQRGRAAPPGPISGSVGRAPRRATSQRAEIGGAERDAGQILQPLAPRFRDAGSARRGAPRRARVGPVARPLPRTSGLASRLGEGAAGRLGLRLPAVAAAPRPPGRPRSRRSGRGRPAGRTPPRRARAPPARSAGARRVGDRRDRVRARSAPGRRGAPACERSCAAAAALSHSMSTSGFAASRPSRNASGPSARMKSSGSCPPGSSAKRRLLPGSSSGSARYRRRGTAAFSPASSPSKQRIGSSAICQRSRSWSSVSAVPSGATVASNPAATQAMTSI